MEGLCFSDLESLNLAVTRRIRKHNKLGIYDGIKKFPERRKRVIEVQEEYIERM